jgi:hypothetical protein
VTVSICKSRTLHFDKGNNTIDRTVAYHIGLTQQQRHHGAWDIKQRWQITQPHFTVGVNNDTIL